MDKNSLFNAWFKLKSGFTYRAYLGWWDDDTIDIPSAAPNPRHLREAWMAGYAAEARRQRPRKKPTK